MSPLSAAALVALSAASFGAMAIFARHAYAEGVDLYGILLPRFVIAALVLWAVARLLRTPWPGRARVPGLALMGAGYVAQSLCFFAALNYIPAGMVALLLYLYPLFVVLLSWAVGHERLGARKLLALAICSAGTVMTLGWADVGAQASLDWRGVALAIGAAAVYALYIVGGSRATRGVEPLAATATILGSSALLLALIVGARLALGAPVAFAHGASAWSAVLAIALVSTVVAVLFFVVGLRHLGASKTALISTLEPVVTVALAAVFLSEHLGGWQLAGGALVLAGALLLALEPAAASPQQLPA
ncbi:DMT family transporter [Schlegelella sp. S2-27]|uniref:DMT family transporter n=1 Tax=Caldimonas mangrovi TaxID=2944811 RepID=A0ABT0YNH4_9BURK|nr:DMT family transporter [Caldimonas mangrovi]MCM5680203.1 DMT family transporter [Caldimonas mangrovi]